MQLYIDSGATKTQFILKADVHHNDCFLTSGINANYTSSIEIAHIFDTFITYYKSKRYTRIKTITYYGAGCLNQKNAEMIRSILIKKFPDSTISVFSDLMAPCHALCHNKSGYVGILGTGSASCFYDGQCIADQAPSLGYLLGDDGGGCGLGKSFITAFLSGYLSSESTQMLRSKYDILQDNLLTRIYADSHPQQIFSSMAKILSENIDNQEIKEICKDSFRRFFQNQLHYYNNTKYDWYLSGSVAFYFQNLIREVAEEKQLNIVKIIQNPLTEITNFQTINS